MTLYLSTKLFVLPSSPRTETEIVAGSKGTDISSDTHRENAKAKSMKPYPSTIRIKQTFCK